MATRLLCALILVIVPVASGQSSPQKAQEPVLPYYPSLDLASMDRTVDPCLNFYEYSCGGWKKNNPIPSRYRAWTGGARGRPAAPRANKGSINRRRR